MPIQVAPSGCSNLFLADDGIEVEVADTELELEGELELDEEFELEKRLEIMESLKCCGAVIGR